MGTRPQAADADLLFDVASVSTPGRRAGAWADALCEHYYPLELATRPGNFSVGRMYIRDIAALRVGTLECDPMEVRLRPEHVRKQVDEFYMIPLTGRSPLTLTQFGRAGDLRPGDLGFVCTGAPYVYSQPERDRFTALRMPAGPVRDRIPFADDLTARAFAGDTAMVAIFLDYVRSCLAHGHGLGRGQLSEQSGVLKCLADLLALAISAPAAADSGESAVRTAHRQRALRFIDANLARPELRPGLVASNLGLSPRYLQRLFAEQGLQVSGLIRARRIAEARQRLAAIGPCRPSVTQIAYDVGFTDPAHFSRAFRTETGMSPSAFMEAAQNAARD